MQLGAFRTYPDDYKPPESESSYQSVPLDKVKLSLFLFLFFVDVSDYLSLAGFVFFQINWFSCF